jgi:eukaryotic-like serine/threonine-protein kinase
MEHSPSLAAPRIEPLMDTKQTTLPLQRWQQVKQIFQAAIELAPAERADYLRAVCAGDDALRDEVAALIRAHEQSGSFMDSPPQFAPVTDEHAGTLAGQTLGHYQIAGLLGRGGMGEVYRARDTVLGREAAIKILPAAFASDQSRLRRFEQEARAASALNHPNIVTVYEIGQAAIEAHSIRFIATEFVAGETLRWHLQQNQLPLTQTLEIAVQMASGLQAAHEAGIVHRDIKPENVMLRPDGLVKILDFGLAKLAERPAAGAEDSPDTGATTPGTVMGTARYMSPEQARGQVVDARTDIFSFGVVLFEMIAGGAPFAGATTADLIAAILEREPPPLAADVPVELQRIVSKTLRKDRAERYQTSAELLHDLKSLREELSFAAKLESAGRRASAETAPRSEASAGTGRSVARRKRILVAGLAVGLAFIAALAYGLYRFTTSKSHHARFENLKTTRLTTTGQVYDIALSPDGKYIAYANGGSKQVSLRLRQVATSQERELVQIEASAKLGNLAFSPDGNYVYYTTATDPTSFLTALHRVSTLGGAPRKLAAGGVRSPVSFSPDGQRLVFVRGHSSTVSSELIIANSDGTNEQVLATVKVPQQFLDYPAWSPDGKIIACPFLNAANTRVLAAVAVEGGQQTIIGAETWDELFRSSWLPDSSGLVVSARKSGETLQLWFISYPSGAARQLTHDLNDYYSNSLSADGRTLLALYSDSKASIWIAPGDKPEQARETTSVIRRANADWVRAGLSWTPDNRLLYTTDIQNATTLWTMDASGGDLKQLPVPEGMPSISSPKMTPDGRYLLFAARHKDVAGIWRMDADGGNLRQLVTLQKAQLLVDCSPDSQWIVYVNTMPGQGWRLWKMSIDGGEPVQLTDFLATWPSISPDGKQIACSYSDQGTEGRAANFGLISFDGGPATKIAKQPHSATFPNYQFKWMPDGRAVAFLDQREGVPNIWMVPISGGEPRPLTRFKSDGVIAFAWSRDGKWLAFSRISATTDVVLLSEGK